MNRSERTGNLVMAAMMVCLVMVATFLIRIPSPFTHGYLHLGDAMVFMSVMVLGRNRGSVAAGIGSALADILGGYAAYAPWTFVIKGMMAFTMGLCMDKSLNKMIGMVLGGLLMVAGYIAVDGIFAGNMMSGILGAPFNVMQFAVGMVLTVVLSGALYKTPIKKYFSYTEDKKQD
ncbi:MAG: ECF transporter S component [Firmicutes bacterium]|nr:ECF transporter S component [Bacillota bacterium]